MLLLSACLAIPEMNAFKRRLDAPTGNSDAQPNASKAAETLQVAATGGKLVHALADFVSTAALAAVLFFTFRDLSHLQCDLPTENLPVPGKVMCNSGRVVWGTYCTLPIIFSLYATTSHLLTFGANYDIRFCNLILIFSVHLVVLKQRIVDIRRCPDCKVRTQEQATEEERVELVERVDLEQQTGLLQEENTNLHTPEK